MCEILAYLIVIIPNEIINNNRVVRLIVSNSISDEQYEHLLLKRHELKLHINNICKKQNAPYFFDKAFTYKSSDLHHDWRNKAILETFGAPISNQIVCIQPKQRRLSMMDYVFALKRKSWHILF